MLPAWATVAISLGAAFITGATALVASLVRGRQERALQLRDRRTDVAGEFSRSALEGIAAIRDTVRSPPPGDPATGAPDTPGLLEQLHRAETEVGLVLLVFGTRSDAGRQAETVRDLLRAAELEFKDAAPEELWVKVGEVRHKADEAEGALKRFMDTALKVLEE
jgi:hypothetical protein